jgi:serine/threonine protein kinase/tetratricopeptide (TPR) repeat protein
MDTPMRNLERGIIFAGRFEVIEELGRGGMGSVYRVIDRKINEEVALKLIKPEIVDGTTIERFSNELKCARKIAHRNVCKTFDLGEDKGTHYITMEYVPGEDLKSMIRMTRQMGVRTAVIIAKQICEGLAEAHRLGIVHRDLKPSNIIIDKEGNARIMDFGIARSLSTGRQTAAGIMVGTPEYMSPEQAEVKEVDQRSDIYSMGIILFEMLTGKVPFEGETPLGVALKHKKEKPPDPKKLNPDIPDHLNRLILKCLEKDKEKRFQNTKELQIELTRIEESLPTTERDVSKRKPITSREITVKFNLRKAFLPAFVILAVIVAGVIGRQYLFKSPAVVAPEDMTDIAVISFENQTGDRSFDYLQDAIPNLLITSLEQSRYIRVTSWERLNDLLKQLGKNDVEVIDRELGFELCRIDGINAIVLGTFTKAENIFATDVKVLDVETRTLLKSVSARGEGVDSILRKQIDELSRAISQEIGLPERITAAKTSPIAEVMTDNMEAYNYYLRGREDYEKFYYNDARRVLERAVEMDPEFAMAHFYLGRVYDQLGKLEEAKEAYEKFSKYGKKYKGKEGLYIEAIQTGMRNPEKYVSILKEIEKKYPKEKQVHFDLAVYYQRQNMQEKAIEEYNKALELDPNYGFAMNHLGYQYSAMGEFEKALECFSKYASISPGDANPFDSMGETYFRMGKLDEAIEKFKEALEVKPDFGSDWRISFMYVLKGNYQKAMEWADQYIAMASTAPLKGLGHLWKSICYYNQGKLVQALQETDKAEELAREANNLRLLDHMFRIRIWMCNDWGKMRDFLHYANARYDFRKTKNYRYQLENEAQHTFYLGMLDLKEGNITAAKARLAEIQKLLDKMEPEVRRLNETSFHVLNNNVLLAEGLTDEAVSAYNKMESFQIHLSDIYTVLYMSLPYHQDFYARAFLKKGEIEKAIAEYEKLVTINPKTILAQPPLHPFSFLRLAKAYEQKGLKEEAVMQYEKVLGIWQDADPGLLPVQEARERLQALRSE